MKYHKSFGERLFDYANVIFMLILVLLTIYPFLHVFFASISKASLVEQKSFFFYPEGINFNSYKLVFKNQMILLGYRNTLIYVTTGTFISILFTTMGAYALSRKKVYFNRHIMMMIIITMYFSGGLVPFYLLVKGLNLINTVFAIILPGAISTWNLIIMRTSFKSVPDSFEESAKIDGANDFRILFSVYVPLSMPVIAVMVMFYAVGQWNSWFGPAIFLENRSLFPIQLILREILVLNSTNNLMRDVAGKGANDVAANIKYTTIIVTILPIIFCYPFLQKYFIKGVMIGSLKE